jgi:hypothetical protein
MKKLLLSKRRFNDFYKSRLFRKERPSLFSGISHLRSLSSGAKLGL